MSVNSEAISHTGCYAGYYEVAGYQQQEDDRVIPSSPIAGSDGFYTDTCDGIQQLLNTIPFKDIIKKK